MKTLLLALILGTTLLTGSVALSSPQPTLSSEWRRTIRAALISEGTGTYAGLNPKMATGVRLTVRDSVDLLIGWDYPSPTDSVLIGILYGDSLVRTFGNEMVQVSRFAAEPTFRGTLWRRALPPRMGAGRLVWSYTACLVLWSATVGYSDAMCTPSAYLERNLDGTVRIYDVEPNTEGTFGAPAVDSTLTNIPRRA